MKSRVKTSNHEENIFNSVLPDPSNPLKGALHRSKFNPRIAPTGTTLGLKNTSAVVSFWFLSFFRLEI